MMLIRLEAGTAELGVIGVAEVPICYGRALRGAGIQVVRLSGQLIQRLRGSNTANRKPGIGIGPE
jgi:hypothetical protein